MNNQPPRVLFETVGKLAGINVLFDPEYTPGKNQSIELTNATLEEALDYLAVMTKSFWKPLSANTIFVTKDNATKRRDYEEQVVKVFYLTNVNTPQELQEIVTAIRSVADIQRLFVYNSQNAIIVRGEADQIALAEKIIADLDKPKSEVVVDVIVMETSTAHDPQAGRHHGRRAASTCPSSTTRGSTSARASWVRPDGDGTGDGHHYARHPAFEPRQMGHLRLRRDPAGRPAPGRDERPRHARAAIAAGALAWTTRRPR